MFSRRSSAVNCLTHCSDTSTVAEDSGGQSSLGRPQTGGDTTTTWEQRQQSGDQWSQGLTTRLVCVGTPVDQSSGNQLPAKANNCLELRAEISSELLSMVRRMPSADWLPVSGCAHRLKVKARDALKSGWTRRLGWEVGRNRNMNYRNRWHRKASQRLRPLSNQ